MIRKTSRSTIASVLLVIALGGCGGGGGGGSGSASGGNGSSSSGGGGVTTTPTPTVPTPSTPSGPTLSISASTVSSQADTSIPAPTVSVSASAINPPTATFYYRYQWSGTAIVSVNESWTTATSLQLSMNLWPPANLGAGTYSGTLQLEFCLDSDCKEPFADSPKTVAVNYTVTGDALPISTFSLSSSLIEAESSATGAAVSAPVRISVANTPSYPMYARFNASAVNSASTIDFVPDSNSSAVLNINFKDAASLTAGIHTDTLVVDICFDRLCSRKSKDSPRSVAISYNVLAVEGRDFSRIVVTGHALDMAWDAGRARLFAVMQGASQFSGNLLARINPTNGVVEATAVIAGEPALLALSDDGQYAYVAYTVINSFEHAIERIRLDTMTSDATIHLEMPTNFVNIGAIAVAPGQPETLAILTSRAGFAGAVIYEQGVKKGEWGEVTTPSTFPTRSLESLQWGSTASTLYTHDANADSLLTLSYSSGTLSLSDTLTGLNAGCSQLPISLCKSSRLLFEPGLIKTNLGAIFDTTLKKVVGNYPLTPSTYKSAIAVDGPHNRDFFYYGDSISSAVRSFDRTSLKPLVTARVAGLDVAGNIAGHVNHIKRWGQSGLAMNTPTNIIIIDGSFATQ